MSPDRRCAAEKLQKSIEKSGAFGKSALLLCPTARCAYAIKEELASNIVGFAGLDPLRLGIFDRIFGCRPAQRVSHLGIKTRTAAALFRACAFEVRIPPRRLERTTSRRDLATL